MQNPVARTFADPANIILLVIVILTVGLMFHGKTLCLIPRYRGMEVQSKDSGEQWLLDDKVNFEKLDNVKLYADPKQNPEWQPPCLPNEAPDYQEKQKLNLEKNLEATGVKVVVDSIEKEFQKATKDLFDSTSPESKT